MKQRLYYLGPEGSFTHQAAVLAAGGLQAWCEEEIELYPLESVSSIVARIEQGEGWGIVAWENNVEGYVVPNLDALIDSRDVVGFSRVGLPITFDAFVTTGAVFDDIREVAAHPHGLAQCSHYIESHGWTRKPTTSNAAACRDLVSGQVALAPSICGPLYGLDTVESNIQDFEGGRTDFLILAPRAQAQQMLATVREHEQTEFETIITFIPLSTGAGVLASLLDVLRDAGLNMTSFISRPIKGHDGTYSFIATLDAAPWQQRCKEVLQEVLEHGDWIKTLAVYPRQERPDPPVNAWMLPQGGARIQREAVTHRDVEGVIQRELLW